MYSDGAFVERCTDCVNNEDEAIQIVELKRFDLISLVSEADTMAILRKELHTINRNILILIVTGNSSIFKRVYCSMNGANNYLGNTILPLYLIDVVRFHLKQSNKK